jgi:hypothetical protein
MRAGYHIFLEAQTILARIVGLYILRSTDSQAQFVFFFINLLFGVQQSTILMPQELLLTKSDT